MVNLLSMLLLLCFDFPALSTVYLGLGSEFSSYLFQSPSFSTRVVSIPVAEHNFHVKKLPACPPGLIHLLERIKLDRFFPNISTP